jgi:SAM-dependent methyltransferase
MLILVIFPTYSSQIKLPSKLIRKYLCMCRHKMENSMYMPKNLGSNLSFYEKIRSYYFCFKEYIEFLSIYRKKYTNYLNVTSKVLQRRYPLTANLRSGGSITFGYDYDIYNHLYDLNCDTEKDIVYIDGFQFHGGRTSGNIVEVFIKNVYGFLDVKDKVVIDIGAGIGDSSIYLASRGAKQVVAVEPNRHMYELAKKNIDLNGFHDSIELIWAEITASHKACCEHTYPPLITLNDLVQRLAIDPDILKVDCEGCEYDVILSSCPEILAKFSHVQIEYHYGYKNLARKLEKCGFNIASSSPKYFRPLILNDTAMLVSDGNIKAPTRGMYIGRLYAQKV